MAPLPENETAKVIIIDLLKVLMGELEIEFWPLGSRTFKNEFMEQGIEPYDCFYIENEAQVGGKKQIDLTVDRRPDFVWEIDS